MSKTVTTIGLTGAPCQVDRKPASLAALRAEFARTEAFSHARSRPVTRYFFNASARVVIATFISTLSVGLSLASRDRLTILSATSMPAMTLPNTV